MGDPVSDEGGRHDRVTFFNRPPRMRGKLPSRSYQIASPPSAPAQASGLNLLAIITPVLFLLVSGITFLQVDGTNRPLALVSLGGMTVISLMGSVGTVYWERRSQANFGKKQQIAFGHLLDKQQGELQKLRAEQQRVRLENDPSPENLVQLARERESRLWERRPGDDDFLRLRLGIGELPSSVAIVSPRAENPGPDLDRAQRIADEYAIVRDVPVTVDLRRVGSLGIVGPTEAAANMLRVALVNLAVHHAPEEIRIAAVLPVDMADEWQWLQTLPHARPLQADSKIAMIASTGEEADQLLLVLLNELSRRERQGGSTHRSSETPTPLPHVVLVLIGREGPVDHVTTGYLLRRGRDLGASVICVVNRRRHLPGDVSTIAEIVGSHQVNISTVTMDDASVSCIPDQVSRDDCGKVAGALEGLRLKGSPGTGDLRTNVRLLALLRFDLQSCDPIEEWRRRRFGPLAVPIGEQAGGMPLLFDLRTHGPHGIIAGTTGSGKSELLQTLVTGLALTNDPRSLNFVLVDYKGGGSLGIFRRLPHCVGLITNLNPHLAERALTAFQVELKRRQQVFAEAGNAGSIEEYQRRRPSAVMPNLVIVIDEFAELARELPDFMDRMISIAQIGRSLGVHLVLATQRPSGVVNPNIWANTRFRICLRVESLQDSRDVLGRPDAALIPHTAPGRGYFQVGQATFQLFQTARVATAFQGALPSPVSSSHEPVVLMAESARIAGLEEEPTDAEVVVALLAEAAQRLDLSQLPRPWSEPLPQRVTLRDVFRSLGWPTRPPDREGAWEWPQLPRERWLKAPIGLIDDIGAQMLRPMVLDFERQTTHVLVAGSAGSGKSTFIRTLVISLALTHDPSRIWFYLVDVGRQALAPLREFPHVAGYFRPNETARIQRLMRRLRTEIDRRKALLGESGATNLWQYTEIHPHDSLPSIIVVIDNLAGFREEFEEELPTLAKLVREGKGVGIHVILTVDRPSSLPGSLLSNVELRLALRLTDTVESIAAVNRSDASQLSVETPGRGFYHDQQLLEFQTALPIEDLDDETQVLAVEQVGKTLKCSWQGSQPERIELLPDYVSLGDLMRRPLASVVNAGRGRLAVPIAFDDQLLCPVAIDLTVDGPHMLILGMVGSGKSAALRTWVRALATYFSSEHVQFVLIGVRRSLRALRQLRHVLPGGYVENVTLVDEIVDRLNDECTRRREAVRELWAASPDSDADVRAPGPEIFIVIDDAELIFASAGGAANSLADIAKGGRDLGIHLIVAGNSDELIRTYGYIPLIQQLRAGRAGILLRVSDPADGQALGVRLPYNVQLADYPPGRAHLVTNTEVRLVQLAISDAMGRVPKELSPDGHG